MPADSLYVRHCVTSTYIVVFRSPELKFFSQDKLQRSGKPRTGTNGQKRTATSPGCVTRCVARREKWRIDS